MLGIVVGDLLRISILFLFRFFTLRFCYGPVVVVVRGRAVVTVVVVVVVTLVVVLLVGDFRRGRVPANAVAVPVVRLEPEVRLTVKLKFCQSLEMSESLLT